MNEWDTVAVLLRFVVMFCALYAMSMLLAMCCVYAQFRLGVSPWLIAVVIIPVTVVGAVGFVMGMIADA
jgi:hypothetical protein